MSDLTTRTDVPFQDLARLHDSIGDELRTAVDGVIARSDFVGAAVTTSFEAAFAHAHEVDHAVGCGSGTDALALALRALGIGPGDEVIVPAMTFVASAEAVVHVGADPVLVDVDSNSLLIDPGSVDSAITSRTRAIMPVHLFGHIVPFDLIDSWRARGLAVVEDAAQAHLGSWHGRSVGTAGDAACFSFYPGKNLGALGDGGAVVTNRADVADGVARLRDHGRRSKYLHEEIGWCSRLDGLQAAVLETKLRHLPQWTAQRRVLADRYEERLGRRLVPWEDGAVHHLLVIRVDPVERDSIADGLARQGVRSAIHYPVALTDQPSLARWVDHPTPNAAAAAGSVLSLPMDPLMRLSEVELTCDVLETLW